MKNYCLDKSSAHNYIVDTYENSNGTLSVVFADGRVFRHIAACDENIEKIIAVQEEQAKKGVADYKTFKSREKSSAVKTALSGLGILTAGVGASFIPAIQDTIMMQSPTLVYAGIGLVAIAGTIPAYAKLRKNSDKVRELDKLRFREEHLDELQQFRSYPNALVGVSPKVASWIRKEEDPFCILYIDEYTLDDLKKIVSNIQVEKEYGFTYQKRFR